MRDMAVSRTDIFFFFFVTLKPRVEWNESIRAFEMSPPRNRFTILQSSPLAHKRPFVGVSEARYWSHWLVFVSIWRELHTLPEESVKSVKIDF